MKLKVGDKVIIQKHKNYPLPQQYIGLSGEIVGHHKDVKTVTRYEVLLVQFRTKFFRKGELKLDETYKNQQTIKKLLGVKK